MTLPNGPTQVAGSFIDALKGQPLSLALVVMNVLLVGYLYYEGVQAHNERQIETKLMYENRAIVAKMLADCYPAPKDGR
jgi:hypothetical protein